MEMQEPVKSGEKRSKNFEVFQNYCYYETNMQIFFNQLFIVSILRYFNNALKTEE